MNKTRSRLSTLTTAAVAALCAPTVADAYQFIISGDPVVAATEGRCVVASSGTSLVTGTLSATAATAPLEARFRTWDESDGIALRSDAALAFTLIIR